jgi:hypothetical protein
VTAHPWAGDRQTIWERDEGICYLCGQPADPANWHLEHNVPFSRGGRDTYENVGVAHPHCNLAKGPRTAVEFWQDRTCRVAEGRQLVIRPPHPRRRFGTVRQMRSGRWQAFTRKGRDRVLGPHTFDSKALAEAWLDGIGVPASN